MVTVGLTMNRIKEGKTYALPVGRTWPTGTSLKVCREAWSDLEVWLLPLGAGVAGRGAPKCLSMQHLGTHILSNRTNPGFDRASKGGYNGVMYLEDHNRDELISLLSDLQKDAWGFRPKEFDFMSTLQIMRDIEYFSNLLKDQAAEAKEAADPNSWKKYVPSSTFTNTISFS